MREAIGGTVIFYILIPIMFLFIFFISFIMVYASAYRASNYVITQIETCDAGISNCNHSSIDSIKQYVKEKYHYNGNIDFCYNENVKGTIYRTTLYVTFDLPFLENLIAYPVRSESKTIYNVHESTDHALGNNGIVIEKCK